MKLPAADSEDGIMIANSVHKKAIEQDFLVLNTSYVFLPVKDFGVIHDSDLL